jgi:hypothetical protein
MTIPQIYQLPAAVLLVLGGALACFAGYRLFRLVLAIYGFVFGALIALAVIVPDGGTAALATGLAGGLAGMLILAIAYFVGLALVGAGLGAMLAYAGWGFMERGEPPPAAVIVATLVGAIGAMLLQRYMTVLSTAFAGGWTMVVGGLALTGNRGAAARAGEIWSLHPIIPPPPQSWFPAACLALGLLGTAVQLFLTGRKR